MKEFAIMILAMLAVMVLGMVFALVIDPACVDCSKGAW